MTDDLEETEESSEEEDQPQVSSAAPDDELQRLRKQNRDLLKEVKAERKARRDSEFAKLKERFTDLEPEDIEGIPTQKLEAILAKVVPAPAAQEGETTEEVPSAEQAALAQFTAKAGGSGAAAPPTKISFADAKKMKEAGNWAELRQKIAAGLVEGVEAPK